MHPSIREKRWVRKYHKRGAIPVDFIPRGYVIAKPAPGCAVIVTPPGDYRPHLSDKIEDHVYNAGVMISGSSTEVMDLRVGDWVSVAFCMTDAGLSSEWLWFPPIPFLNIRKR